MPRAARTSLSTASAAVMLALELATMGCSERTAAARVVRVDRPDLPLERAGSAHLDRFHEGDALFEATMREADGLGPSHIRASCGGCHQRDGRRHPAWSARWSSSNRTAKRVRRINRRSGLA